MTIDKETKRVSLSYKATLDNPGKNQRSCWERAKGNNVTDKAIFADLDWAYWNVNLKKLRKMQRI